MQLSDPHTDLRPALILRPLLSAPTPGERRIRFGGRPQLPEHIEWPRRGRDNLPCHFFAQIDLGVLPRAMEAGGQQVAMPDFPKVGTLFLFLPLVDDLVYNPQFEIRFAGEEVWFLPERAPPADTRSLLAFDMSEHLIDPTGVSEDEREFRERFAEVLSYLSSRGENPLARNLERDNPSEDLERRGAAHVLFENSLEAVLGRQEAADGTCNTLLASLPDAYKLNEFYAIHGAFGDDLIDWEFVFDWSQRFLSSTIGGIADSLKTSLKNGEVPDALVSDAREIIAELHSMRNHLDEERYTPQKSPLLDLLISLPNRKALPDWQAKQWMKLSKPAHGDVPKWVVRRFIDFLRRIHASASRDDPADLKLLRAFSTHTFKARDVFLDAREALRRTVGDAVPRRQRRKTPEQKEAEKFVAQTTLPLEGGNTFSASGAIVPIQMFGLGYLLQSAAIDNADKVLLFQISDPFGTPLNVGFDGGVLQVWIDPDDLRHGYVERAFSTFETT